MFCFGVAVPRAVIDRVIKNHSNLLFTTTFMDDRATHIKDQNGRSEMFSEEVVVLSLPLFETLQPCVLQKFPHALSVYFSATSEFPTPKRRDPQSKS